MKKHMLMDIFERATESKSQYVFVLIDAEGTEEVVVIPNKSFDAKKKFYEQAYDDDLRHVMNKNVFIKGFDYGFENILPIMI